MSMYLYEAPGKPVITVNNGVAAYLGEAIQQVSGPQSPRLEAVSPQLGISAIIGVIKAAEQLNSQPVHVPRQLSI